MPRSSFVTRHLFFDHSSFVHLSFVILLLLCLFGQTMAHARAASITFDEGPHLATGYATLRTGDLRLQPVHIHPPLANVMAVAPLLLQDDLPDPRTISGWEIASLSAVTDGLVWQYPHPRRMALAARFPIVGMTLLLGALVFRWAADLFGKRAGTLALFLLTFDPNVIAHGSLVTTDMAVVLWGTTTFFLVTRYLSCSQRQRPWRYWSGVGVALGLALASKVSAISLIPPLGVLFLLGPRLYAWKRRLLALSGSLALAGMVLWAVYGFEVAPVPGLPIPLPAATHLKIYQSLQAHYELGHPAFLLGMNSSHGWRYYFPVAFVLKTPLATLLLLGFAVYRFASGQVPTNSRSTNSRQTDAWRKHQLMVGGILLLYPILYIASTFFSSVNIGYRHLLPLLPFMFVGIAGCGLKIASLRFKVFRFVFYALLLSLPVIALCISPHYLAYFNVPGGHRYLVDSNLDWGQNLWQLRDWMAKNDVDKVYYAHFSPARPGVYGVEADFLPPDPRAVDFTPFDPAPGIYAIGATVLQGAYTPDVNTYAWFRTREPIARLGGALFIYESPPRPQLEWAAVCASPAPVLSPESVQESLGARNLRMILPDCTQGWLYPEEPGVYVLPPEEETPPEATLSVATRTADGTPACRVFRVNWPPLPAHPVSEGLRLDGPLAFLGYDLDAGEIRPGETLELRTYWRVEEAAKRPLSLMAHLVAADGAALAIGDGLGIPIDQWRPGDLLVQRHWIAVAEGTPAGNYQIQTGAYWLDTMERWAIYGADEASYEASSDGANDSIPLANIQVLE